MRPPSILPPCLRNGGRRSVVAAVRPPAHFVGSASNSAAHRHQSLPQLQPVALPRGPAGADANRPAHGLGIQPQRGEHVRGSLVGPSRRRTRSKRQSPVCPAAPPSEDVHVAARSAKPCSTIAPLPPPPLGLPARWPGACARRHRATRPVPPPKAPDCSPLRPRPPSGPRHPDSLRCRSDGLAAGRRPADPGIPRRPGRSQQKTHALGSTPLMRRREHPVSGPEPGRRKLAEPLGRVAHIRHLQRPTHPRQLGPRL
jgi:hypothetical protein